MVQVTGSRNFRPVVYIGLKETEVNVKKRDMFEMLLRDAKKFLPKIKILIILIGYISYLVLKICFGIIQYKIVVVILYISI